MSVNEDIVKEIIVDYFCEVLKKSVKESPENNYREISYKLYESYEKALNDINNKKVDSLIWHPV